MQVMGAREAFCRRPPGTPDLSRPDCWDNRSLTYSGGELAQAGEVGGREPLSGQAGAQHVLDVEHGEYQSVSEVVRAALRPIQRRQAVLDAETDDSRHHSVGSTAGRPRGA